MQIRFYKNGSQNGNTSVIPYSFPTNSDPVRIGNSVPYNLPVRGWIDEMRLWNSQLTAAQVAQFMFVSCRGISSSNLLAAYNFDGNLLNSSATGGINGSLNNGSANTCRFSGYLNDTIAGATFISYIPHTTVINRTGSPNPFPNGYALRTPYLGIPDNNPTGVSDSMTIYNPVIAVSSIEVFLSIRHTWVGDLTISIRAPNGQVRNIIAFNGANGDNVLSFFNDNFPDVVTTPTYLPPWGYVKPISILGTFTGAAVNGTWLIKCVDGFAGDAGILLGWGIRFNNVVSADPVTGIVPDRFNLYQNYPNPFNPVTKIKFDLPKDVNVTVRLYDILGREVLLIADGFYKAGTHSIDFDGSSLSSGTYFYRIQAGDPSASSRQGFTDTKKMVLVK
jgi:subtilisin-like proprotein convertase family protein